MHLDITTYLIASVIKDVIALGALLTIVAYTVWLERKVVMSYVSPQQINAFRPARVRVHARLKPGYHS